MYGSRYFFGWAGSLRFVAPPLKLREKFGMICLKEDLYPLTGNETELTCKCPVTLQIWTLSQGVVYVAP